MMLIFFNIIAIRLFMPKFFEVFLKFQNPIPRPDLPAIDHLTPFNHVRPGVQGTRRADVGRNSEQGRAGQERIGMR
jgi:hypothetical protein